MTPVDVAPLIAVLVCLQAIRVMVNQNHYVREFSQAGAVSPQASKTLSELELSDTRIFRILVRHRVIEQTAQDQWFLDPQRAAAFRARRFKVALPTIALGIIGVGIAWMLVR